MMPMTMMANRPLSTIVQRNYFEKTKQLAAAARSTVPLSVHLSNNEECLHNFLFRIFKCLSGNTGPTVSMFRKRK